MTTVRGLRADLDWRTPSVEAGRATVASSFQHALNLRTGAGTLLSVLTRSGRPAPGVLIVDIAGLPRVPAGTEARFGTHTLIGSLTLDLTALDWFDCRLSPLADPRPAPVPRLTTALSAVAGVGSFTSRPGATPYELAVAARLHAGRRAYRSALASHTSPASAVSGLVGLGPGLTPAGDDYLVGGLALLGSVTDPAGRARAFTQEVADAVQPCLHRTTDVSAHYLRAAARGRFHHDVRAAAEAALRDAADLEAVFQRLSEVGSTSGGDALLGIVDAVAALGLDRTTHTSSTTTQSITAQKELYS